MELAALFNTEAVLFVDYHQSEFRESDIVVYERMGAKENVNLPCGAGLGNGGEGYLSYSIATPTGEGVTTPLTFTRQRRFTIANGGMRVI